MAEFAHNNAKNPSIGHTPFELNYGYHSWISYEKEVDPGSKSKSADALSAEPRKLMIVCRKNLHHAQELQKRAHDKGVKPRSYAPDDKVWLNSKYIKTKQNRKLEAKFFGLFRVLYPVGKQAYKLELPNHGSSTPEKLHSTLFWPSPSSSKSLIIQVPYHPSLSSTKPRLSCLHQSQFFLPCP